MHGETLKFGVINHLKTSSNPFYLKTQFVPHSKHLSPRL